MNCDNNRISNIETLLKTNPISISNNDLIYYLKCNSNNSILDPDNLNNTKEYLDKINISFSYSNIFVNTTNYGSISQSIIGLLLTFYYFYPRFYKIGFIGTLIGILCLSNLYSKVNSLYSNLFSKIGMIYIIVTFIIYFVFFILLNNLNHYILLFLSAVIAFLIINYILRLVLTTPSNKNKWNKYNATYNNKDPNTYTEYNELLETACYQIMKRYNMKLPSGNMLYSYLTVFDIKEPSKGTEVGNFLVNFFGPLISIGILYFLGGFLSELKIENKIIIKRDDGKEIEKFENTGINLFPIVGINNSSKKYYTCQANYILPKELNIGLLIHEHIDKYKFDDKLYMKVEKALMRISKELLLKYNPKFYKSSIFKKLDPVSETYKLLEENEIEYQELMTTINNKTINKSDYDKIKEFILDKFKTNNPEKSNNPEKNNREKNKILKSIDNIFSKKLNKNNYNYFNEEIVEKLNPEENKILEAIEKILDKNNISITEILKIIHEGKNNNLDYDERLDTLLANKIKEFINDQVIPYKDKKEMLDLIDHISNTLKVINEKDEKSEDDHILARDVLEMFDREISKEHQKKLKELKILDDYIDKFKNNLEIKDQTLFGYHYNIFGYNFFGDKIRLLSNKFFSIILRLLSTWLLFSKPIGSSWLFSSYISTSAYGYKKLFNELSGKSPYFKIFWKYFGMGLDRSYFEEKYISVRNNTETGIARRGKEFLKFIFPFIFLMIIFNMFNSICFGFTIAPSWNNLIIQFVFIVNIIVNIIVFKQKSDSNEGTRYLGLLNLLFWTILLLLIIFIVIIIVIVTFSKINS